MKTQGYFLVALSFFTFLAPNMDSQLPVEISSSEAHAQEDCAETLSKVLEDESFLRQLENPIITTTDELAASKDTYLRINECLHSDLSAFTDELMVIDILTEYFLVIVGGMQTPARATELYLVDLATSENSAVKQIREEAKLEPPSGYVYLRLYSSREAMPDLVRKGFEDERTVGVTMLSRYIAVLAEDEGSSLDLELQSQSLPKTISHELIHAYINSLLGFEKSARLPTWYHEGLAIFFSGSGQSSYVYLSPDITIRSVSPEDYEQYELNFKYLEAKLGRERLLALIKQSVENADPSLLYKDLDIPSDNWLEASARGWQKHEDAKIRKWGLFAMALLGLVIFVIIANGRRTEES